MYILWQDQDSIRTLPYDFGVQQFKRMQEP